MRPNNPEADAADHYDRLGHIADMKVAFSLGIEREYQAQIKAGDLSAEAPYVGMREVYHANMQSYSKRPQTLADVLNDGLDGLDWDDMTLLQLLVKAANGGDVTKEAKALIDGIGRRMADFETERAELEERFE
jgi:hypothetical protein